jgi:heme/copper-type cytochrome/quinol oxidase subunit 2
MRQRLVKLFFLSGLVAAIFALLPSPSRADSGELVVEVKAAQYAYNPAVIDVRFGQKVVLELSSLDVVHGLYLDGYELEVESDPGQTTRLSFIADRPGSFRFRCSVTCGPLHPFMIGQLRVQPYAMAKLITSGSLSALLFGLALAFRHDP